MKLENVSQQTGIKFGSCFCADLTGVNRDGNQMVETDDKNSEGAEMGEKKKNTSELLLLQSAAWSSGDFKTPPTMTQ